MASLLTLSALPLLSSSSSRPAKAPFLQRPSKIPPRKHPQRVQSCKFQSFLDFQPKSKPEALNLDLPRFDPAEGAQFDVIIIGSGPAGLRLAEQVSQHGIKVCCLDPSPLSMWPNVYGVWVDEFEDLGLEDCLDKTWSNTCVYIDDGNTKCLDRAYGRVNRKDLKSKMLFECAANGVKFHKAKAVRVEHDEFESESSVFCDNGAELKADLIVDASGVASRFIEYDQDKPRNYGYQIAHGILAEVDSHPYDLDKMVLMDMRDSHLANERTSDSRVPTFLYAMPLDTNTIFLEETCLVSRPMLPYEEIKRRMAARLRQLGIRVRAVIEDEKCVTPLGGPLPRIPQNVVAFGANAGMVHPTTVYMVAEVMARAPVVAKTIVECLGSTKKIRGTELYSRVWNGLWPKEKINIREFHKFAMEKLIKSDLDGLRGAFHAIYSLSPHIWQGYVSSKLTLDELVRMSSIIEV